MDGSKHCISSSPPTGPSQIQFSASDETNENNRNNHQMGSNLKNQKRTTKNFMSPTISAASKAVVPRNILAERNESSESIFSDTHVQNTPNFDPSPSSEFEDEEPKTSVSNSSSKPYDPVTNYLSPRPKFLRYNPNRRRKIFLRHENESKETEDGTNVDKSGSFDSKNSIVKEDFSQSASGSSASSSEEGSVEQEGEEMEENEDEFEKVEEERGWNLNGVLNTLLVLVVLVLSTMYISSMNSPTPPPALKAIRNLKNGFWIFQNPFLNYFEDGNEEFLDKHEETEVFLADLTQKDSDEWVEVQNMVVVENSYELGEMLELNGGGSKVVEMVGGENNGTVSERDEVLELQVGETEDVCDDKVEIKWEISDLMVEEGNGVQEREAPEKAESLQDYQAPIMSDKEENTDGDFRDEIKESQVIVEEISEEGYQKEGAENESERLGDTSNKEGEVIISEMMNNDEDSNSKLINSDPKANSKDGVVEQIETGSTVHLAMGFSAIFTVVASLVLVFHFKRKRTSGKGPSPGIKPCFDPAIPENSSLVIANEAQEHIEKVDSLVTPLSLSHSMGEASKEIFQTRAPTVELLGEFEVGELSTSSLKSCRMKSRMMESDLSNYSISQEENSRSKGKSVPIKPLSEFSSMGSSSFGSFTAEKKILKK